MKVTLTHKDILPLLKTKLSNNREIERCLVLVDLISSRQYYHKDKNTSDKEKWVGIHSKFLEDLFGSKKLQETKNTLKELGIIFVKTREVSVGKEKVEREFYIPGKQPKQYRLNPKYFISLDLRNTFKARKIKDKVVLKGIEKAKKKSEFNTTLYSTDFKHVLDNLLNVGIDKEGAMNYILESNLLLGSSNYKTYNLLCSIHKIKEGDIYYTRSENGRLTTTLSNLKRELRQFLFDRVDGTFDFVEVDIRNAQPLLLCTYIEKYHANVIQEKDFVQFREYCREGIIYDKIASLFERNRQWVKDRFMDVLLFTKRNQIHLLKVKNPNDENREKLHFIVLMQKHFPTIWNTLLKIKQTKDNRDFACEIQRLESTLMIDHVLVALKDIGTNFSIHDSIVCRTADALTVQNLITEKFMELHNSPVTLKVKNLYEKV